MPASEKDELFRPRCLSLDLEVGRQHGRIGAFGAVRADTLRQPSSLAEKPLMH